MPERLDTIGAYDGEQLFASGFQENREQNRGSTFRQQTRSGQVLCRL